MKFKPKKNNTFFRNLQPRLIGGQATTPPHRRAGYHPASSAGRLQPSRGFTLIELLVTLSLFVALTTIVLFSSSSFNGSILLTNLAYDVAITIRQAQSFGVNVREVASGGGDFQSAYGVHFDTTDGTHFILFADTSGGDGKYTKGSDLAVDTYTIKRGNKISGLCIDSSCSTSVNKLDITFLRPNPDAIIKGDSHPDATEATIIISSADEHTRNIVVNSTGQISVPR